MELDQIAELRKRLGLTQEELASRAEVSQSLIAKIESGRTEPSYSKGKKILSVLQETGRDQAPTASDLMHQDIYTCTPEDTIEAVVGMMREHDISQVPVVDDGVCGLVTESSLLRNAPDEATRVDEVMESAPPTIAPNMPEPAVRSLLQHVPIVVVTAGNDLLGVITKSDILSRGYTK